MIDRPSFIRRSDDPEDMREFRAVWERPRPAWLAVVAAALVAAVNVFGDLLPALFGLRPVLALPVVLGLLLGPIGVWGSALGAILADLFAGTVGVETLVSVLGYGLLATVSYVLWGAIGPTSTGRAPDLGGARAIPAYLVVALVASATYAAVTSWALAAIGRFPFVVLGVSTAIRTATSVLLVGGPLLVAGGALARRLDVTYPALVARGEAPPLPVATRRSSAVLVAVPLAWLLVGTGIGLLGQAISVVPADVLTKYAPVQVVEATVALFGPGDRVTQTALGLVGLLVVLWALAASRDPREAV